jgi:2,3-bisphosphoglycerate-independent phosphoglycerate mutase
LHVLLDGRDVPDGSAEVYLDALERHLELHRGAGVDACVASGGGRMLVTMDRYDSDWSIVERGYRAHVLGEAEHVGPSARSILAEVRRAQPSISDQQLPPFVVVDANGLPVGAMHDGDAVLLANFRGDRAIQFCRSMEEQAFSAFDRPRRPNVAFAGMMEYDGDLKVPTHYLVAPPVIEATSGEYLAHNGIRTFACSETQKYGHVTYFWNGNRSEKFDDQRETYCEVPSLPPPVEVNPHMAAEAVADAAIDALQSGRYDLVRINFANGDMVGHTGNLEATKHACRVVDAQLTRVLEAVQRVEGRFLVVADHGNADDMAQRDKDGRPRMNAAGAVMARTSHTLAPVPCVVGGVLPATIRLRDTPSGLASVAATTLNLLGFSAPTAWAPSLLDDPDQG